MIDLVDFHSHILPGMDDGARDEDESLEMLEEAYAQGVRGICATPHYYAFDESPESFLERREASVRRLIAALEGRPIMRPSIAVGAEVHYFFGMSEAEILQRLAFGKNRYLLVEPPMDEWSDYMISEIELTGRRLKCMPVIAHADRYMYLMDDYSLIDMLEGRRIMVQANNSFFLRPKTAGIARDMLRHGRIHFLGSDCHNSDTRPQNSGDTARSLWGEDSLAYERLHKNADLSTFSVDK